MLPGSSSNIRRRIGLASSAFGGLKEKISQRYLKESQRYLNLTKISLYYFLIIPIALYVSETQSILKENERILNTFKMKCVKSVLSINLRDHVRNERIKQALKAEKTIIDIVHKK